MEQSDWVALTAIVVSVISFGLSFYLSLRSSRASIRPVITIVYEDKSGWCVRNVGNGPALNVVVAQKPSDSDWFRPVRVPPVSAGGNFHLSWMAHDYIHGLGVGYEDFQGHVFTSVCVNDLTNVHKGRVFPQWSDSEIGRHWWENPIKPTYPGEIKGEWQGE